MKAEIRKIKNPPPGVLVPLVRKFMTASTPAIESEEDVKFLTNLSRLMMEREDDRASRNGLGVYSPSSLGEKCVRKSYLGRHAKLDKSAPSPYSELAHYYFLTGNFTHIKWQFALYKMEKWIGNSSIFRIHGCEIPVQSKHGDHRGTIDMIPFVYDEPIVLDFKGLNTFAARKVGYGKIPVSYKMQVADYILLWNSMKGCPFKIERGLLVAEDKTGGENYLQEVVVTLKDDGERVRRRLAKLREYEDKGEMPPPLCKSLKDRNFTSCQFRGICYEEVENAGKAHTRNMRQLLAQRETPTTERVIKILKKGKK